MYLNYLLKKTWKITGPTLFIIASLLCPVNAQDSKENQKTYVIPTPDQLNVQVVPGGELVKLDGILDEDVWQTAEPVTEFWQREPVENVPPTEKTEVRVLQDEHALYFGIMCYDSDPDGIIALDMRRDATLGNDDYLGLYLDTYHDHRNFYYFSTNALGCRRDGIVTDARFYNTAWNGIWQAKAKITEEGWSAEWRIPFSTLHFGGEQPMTWGLNFSRAIRRKQESIRWATVPRELGHAGTWRGEFFGQLNGIKTKSSDKKWEAEPYVLAGGEKKYRPDSTDSKFVPVDDGNISAPAVSFQCHFSSGFPGCSVGQDAYWVDRFCRRPASDEYLLPVKCLLSDLSLNFKNNLCVIPNGC